MSVGNGRPEHEPIDERPVRHQACLLLGGNDIGRLLGGIPGTGWLTESTDLPTDGKLQIVQFTFDQMRNAWVFILDHPSFPESRIGEPLPIVRGPKWAALVTKPQESGLQDTSGARLKIAEN